MIICVSHHTWLKRHFEEGTNYYISNIIWELFRLGDEDLQSLWKEDWAKDVAVTALSSLSCECYARETPTNIPEEEATHTCGCRGRQKLRSTGNSGLTEGGEGEKCVCAEVRKTTETRMERTQYSRCILLRPHWALCPQHLQASALDPLPSQCSE